MGVGLVHGLIYVFVVPPWQHNDEPNHFEYVWLMAHRSSFPKSTDFDPGFSHAVMQSMVTHHFFDGMGYTPDLTSSQPMRIFGYSQLTDPPLYYLIAGLPIRLLNVLVPNASIETQLYTARLTSLVFLLVSILAAWGLMSELTDPSTPFIWMVPLTMALWPGYVDLMTGITNFAGAVSIFGVFMWFNVRLIRRGMRWYDLLGAILSAAACIWMLSVVYVAIPLLVITLLLATLRGRWRWFAWGTMFLSLIACFLAMITWGDSGLWYRETWQTKPTLGEPLDAPLGKKAFQLVVPSQGPPARLYQLIPPINSRELIGKTITLGAWVWATRPIQVSSPILEMDDGTLQYASQFDVTETPTFHAITATLTGETARAWMILSLPDSAEDAGTVVYYDGLVLVDGLYSTDEPPYFENVDGTRGVWGNIPFNNLVRNPSAEKTGPRIRLWLDQHNLFTSYGRISMLLYAIQDWIGMGWYFRETAANLARTLWGRFGWNNVPLLGHNPYRGLIVVTILGLIGNVGVAWRNRKQVLWSLCSWVGLAALMVGALAVARGVFYIWYKPFIPSARYIFPVMSIIVMILCTGWWNVLRIFDRWLPSWMKGSVYFIFFIGLDVYALASLVSFYY